MKYSTYNSPMGKIVVSATKKGICRLDWNVNENIEKRYKGSEQTKDIIPGFGLSLEAYFKGYNKDFSYPLDLSSLTTFTKDVLTAIKHIPYGSMVTYGEIARSIGRPKAVRAVGNSANINPIPIIIPCHRVVAKDGLGGYRYGVGTKLWLLQLEKSGIFQELVSIVDRLRRECPWDSVQTHESLIPFIREECEEVISAIENKRELKAELGDLLLQVLLQSRIAEEFDIHDVCERLALKLKKRHSHIFGGRKATTPEDVKKIWEEEKAKGN